MITGVKGRAHGGDIRGHARCGLVVGGKHRLDLVPFVGREAPGILFDRHAFAPVHLQGLDREPPAPAKIDPQVGKMPETGHQDLVTRA